MRNLELHFRIAAAWTHGALSASGQAQLVYCQLELPLVKQRASLRNSVACEARKNII